MNPQQEEQRWLCFLCTTIVSVFYTPIQTLYIHIIYIYLYIKYIYTFVYIYIYIKLVHVSPVSSSRLKSENINTKNTMFNF